jgi:hypothetical protein
LRIIPHTDKMIRDAHNRAFRLGSLNNSILKGRGNASGYMGEEALAAYLGAKIVSDEQYDYDLVVGGRNVEVKTKQRTVPPKGEYDVSIAATSRHQKPDLYAFISLEFKSSDNTSGPLAYQDLEYVWLLGYKRPEDYFRDAECREIWIQMGFRHTEKCSTFRFISWIGHRVWPSFQRNPCMSLTANR